jgi:ABC-type glycerol-3-phosphate transport system permease component
MRDRKEAAFRYFWLGLILIFLVFPYYWMIISSLKPPEQTMISPPAWWPSRFVFSNYADAWNAIPFTRYLGNSLTYAVLTAVFCTLLSSFAGYSLSRFSFKGKKTSFILLLSTQLLPWVMTIIPFYFVLKSLNLTNTTFGIILAYSTWAIPFCTLMLRGYFNSAIPDSIEESATVDGCTKLGVFFRISLPLSIPGLVATAIFSFILAWNEFSWASIFLTSSEKKPLAVGMYDFIGQTGGTSAITLYMSTAVMTMIPTLIVFGFIQRYMVAGMSAGAVKG